MYVKKHVTLGIVTQISVVKKPVWNTGTNFPWKYAFKQKNKNLKIILSREPGILLFVSLHEKEKPGGIIHIASVYSQ